MKNIIALSLKTVFLLMVVGTIPLMSSNAKGNGHQIYLPLVTRNFDPAWDWQESTMVTLTPNPNYNDPMLMAIDADGNPYIFWDTLYTPRFIYHTRLTSQGWITPTQVADTLGTSKTLFPPIWDHVGNLHLLWRTWLGVGVENPYRLMYSSFSGGTWQPEEEIIRYSQELQGMVHLDAQGGIDATYAGSLFSSMIGHTSHTTTGWEVPQAIDPDHNVRLVWSDMQGGVHLYGESNYPTQHVIYSYWKDGAFLVLEQSVAGDLPTGDSQLDGRNNLHLFRQAQVPVPGGTVYGIYHRCLTSNLSWTDERVLSGEQNTTGLLLKASDQASQVALIWKETTGNLVHATIFENCQQTHQTTIALPLANNWEIHSAALSQNPGRLCILARKLYTSTEFLVQCANIQP